MRERGGKICWDGMGWELGRPAECVSERSCLVLYEKKKYKKNLQKVSNVPANVYVPALAF